MEKEFSAKDTAKQEKNFKPNKQVYGKYGNLALKYMKEYNKAKYWTLGKYLPEYLHNIDKQAETLYEIMYGKLKMLDRYKHTNDFLENARKENEMQAIIEEEILSTLIYDEE